MSFNRISKLTLLLLSTFLVIAFTRAKDKWPRIEAEAGKYVDLTVLHNDQASGGEYLEMQSNGRVVWEVQIPDSGWYNLKIRYRAPQGEKENALIINQVKWRAGFGWAPDWSETARSIVLKSGLNILELEANWGGIDIDCLMIEKISLAPKITPHKNIFYTSYPRDLFIKVNAFGRAIESVTVDGQVTSFQKERYPYEEDVWQIRIVAESLAKLTAGQHHVALNFESGESAILQLQVMAKRKPADLTIIAPDVSHGNSVLFLLPDGKTMLVDCGQAFIRDSVIIPLLEKNGISHLDYLVITHYHEDHDSGDKGQTICEKFKVDNFYDYQSFKAGDSLEIGGVQLKILNAFIDGNDENSRSLAFQLKYHDFIYRHDADIYAFNQQAIMQKFPADSVAQVYFANHHFHGSSDTEYLRKLNPEAVLIQAEQTIYARSTYTTTYLKNTVKWLREKRGKIVANLPTVEVGTIVVHVNSASDWSYETYKDSSIPLIPFLRRIPNSVDK